MKIADNSIFEHECIGPFNYNLYRWGWQSGLHQRLPWLQHHLLSLFLYYRRGYAEGSQKVAEYYFDKQL